MKKFRADLAAFAMVCSLASSASAQNQTIITANLITHDVSGDLLATGYFQLIPQNQAGQTAAFTACGGGQVLPIAYYWPVVNGVITNGTTAGATVPDTGCATPSGVGYQVCITNLAHQNLYCYGQAIHPTGSTWSFDTWSPTQVYTPSPAALIYGGGSPPPSGANQCTAPSFYIQNAATIYTCIGSTWTIYGGVNPLVHWLGAWASGTAYLTGDGVFQTVSGLTSSYVAVASNTGQPPASSPGSWQLIASGASGVAGLTGPAGPAGAAGTPGAAASITIGTITTCGSGTPATVTNAGTSTAVILNFCVPQGPAGTNGTNGAQGSQGPAGATGAAGAPGAAGASGAQGPAGPTVYPASGIPCSTGTAWCSPYSVEGSSTVLVAADYLNNYCPITGCSYTGPVTFGGNSGAMGGIGTAAFVVGATAQAGTGATAVCANYSRCTSYSGTVTFTTGSGTLTPGIVLTIDIPGSRSINPNCPWTFTSSTDTTYRAMTASTGNASVTTISYIAGIGLAPSTTYTANYMCGEY